MATEADQPVHIEYAHFGTRRTRSVAQKAVVLMGGMAAGLTALSLAVLKHPGNGIWPGKLDVVVEVGLGCTLVAGWAAWCVALVALAARRVTPSWTVALLPLGGLMVYVLAWSVKRFLDNMTSYSIPY
jgi:hypothetical protein